MTEYNRSAPGTKIKGLCLALIGIVWTLLFCLLFIKGMDLSSRLTLFTPNLEYIFGGIHLVCLFLGFIAAYRADELRFLWTVICLLVALQFIVYFMATMTAYFLIVGIGLAILCCLCPMVGFVAVSMGYLAPLAVVAMIILSFVTGNFL